MKQKIKSFFKGLFKTTTSTFVTVSVCVVLLLLTIGIPLLKRNEASLDNKTLLSKITKSSELTTAKINFTGMAEFKDAGIAFLNSSDFNMVYEATANIGIDLEKVDVKTNKVAKTVTVHLPHTSVLNVNIDLNTIKYFDTHFSLFNIDQKEDANEANALAVEAAKEEISQMGVIELADEQAKALIKNILIDAIPDDYKIEFEFIK